MANERHPRREGIGMALARAIPLVSNDAEAREERHLARRIDLQEAVRRP